MDENKRRKMSMSSECMINTDRNNALSKPMVHTALDLIKLPKDMALEIKPVVIAGVNKNHHIKSDKNAISVEEWRAFHEINSTWSDQDRHSPKKADKEYRENLNAFLAEKRPAKPRFKSSIDLMAFTQKLSKMSMTDYRMPAPEPLVHSPKFPTYLKQTTMHSGTDIGEVTYKNFDCNPRELPSPYANDRATILFDKSILQKKTPTIVNIPQEKSALFMHLATPQPITELKSNFAEAQKGPVVKVKLQGPFTLA